jgi:4-amino-4-deoxy-L-arabinose transferase-like glycosyltransferase
MRPSPDVTSHPLDRTGFTVQLAMSAIVIFVVVFWRLGAPTFWDPDEAHYAETTRELIATGDWLAPYYNDQPFFDKPILFHWLQAIPMAVGGPTELAARLVPALATLGLVGVTAWIGAALGSADLAVVAALLLATSPAVFALTRYAILDTVFTAFMFGGAGLVSVAAIRRRPRLQWAGYVLIALAVLTKGPVALVLCGLAFGVTILCSEEARRHLLELRLPGGLALIAALTAPWFVYMYLRFRDPFVAGYLFAENIRLFAADRFTPTASSSVWFYFRVLGAGLLPWTALLVGRFYDDLRAAVRRDGSLDVIDVLLWSWTCAIVGFFTISRFKLDHYVFPAAPTLCLICARAWVALRQRPLDPRNAGARVGLHLIGPSMLAAGLAAGFIVITRSELPRAARLMPMALGVAGAAVAAGLGRRRGRPPRVPWIVLGAMTITYGGLVFWVLPEVEQRKVVPDVAVWVARRAAGNDRIAGYRLDRWRTSFRFYVNRHVQIIEDEDEAQALFAGGEPFYCAMLGPAYDAFAAQGLPLRIVYERDGIWATTGRAMWGDAVPPTRFVVVTNVPP